ncbi:hypothetical protein, partial [Kocuria sp.]|uniref:hypothetical protein n=1 Tax=Kocuria sp. TaxID=1871328 RepID=UPI0028A1450C
MASRTSPPRSSKSPSRTSTGSRSTKRNSKAPAKSAPQGPSAGARLLHAVVNAWAGVGHAVGAGVRRIGTVRTDMAPEERRDGHAGPAAVQKVAQV